MSNDSVGQGFGIGIGLIIAMSFLGMLPICGCGGCLMLGGCVGVINEERALDRRLQRERLEQQEAERAKSEK